MTLENNLQCPREIEHATPTIEESQGSIGFNCRYYHGKGQCGDGKSCEIAVELSRTLNQFKPIYCASSEKVANARAKQF